MIDDENPEWTEADFARAKLVSKHPVLSKVFRGAQKAPTKQAVSIRLDADVVEALRASGPGWQGRVNDMLRAAVL
ncbi:BrnA antitoxin family protein [Novosphingobium sp. 9]|uniref:BrnA antitoxin family protein n=1 Tax=Novosphingobium sp. 9 TaxID=2025349 RepID=UPI0021B55264|nr:BrnA antitoxin family protein [Novosphingobium sp. 9]